ncbi:MAG: aldo/keto reductase [Gammaproteobacteria bacterium]|nr:aldo/keto reductase [Gammaproteobacteria bacterium]
MEYRNFGHTDLSCSAVGFGTWEMGTTQYGEIDIRQAVRAVEMAVDHGITLFDTAEVYGPFTSEELLARGLGARRKDVVLVTKVGFAYRDDPDASGPAAVAGRDASPAHITEHTEGCLERLGTDYLDLLLIHWPDHKTPHEDTIAALEAMKEAGKIRHYGVSNYDVPMMAECERHGHLTANQVGYHMFDRRMEAAVLPYCQAQGIGYMAYGSLGFGLLTGAFTPDTTFVDWDWRSSGKAFGLPLFEREHFLKELKVVERLREFAADSGHSVAQLAIAWLLGNRAVTVGLVGMRNETELEENVAAADWRLSDADRATIDGFFAAEGVPTYVDAKQAA